MSNTLQCWIESGSIDHWIQHLTSWELVRNAESWDPHKTNWIQICILTSSLELELHNEFFKVLLGSREDGNNSGLCHSPDEECQKKVKKRTMLSLVREQKMLLRPQRGEISITIKAQKVSERREALGWATQDGWSLDRQLGQLSPHFFFKLFILYQSIVD